jgi:PilZ domain
MEVPTSLPQQDFSGKVSDLRRRARIVVRMPATVAGKTGLTNGVVTNLSEAGCALQLSTSFRPSHHLTLKLYAQDGTPALLITLAGNRWMEKDWIGVEFLSMSEKDKAKLQHLCGGSRSDHDPSP